MSEVMHGLTTEHKAARIQAATQAEQASVASSSKLTTEEVAEAAIQHLQELESHLDPTRLVALINRIQREPSLGRVYMALQQEDTREAWILKRLAEEGFGEGVAFESDSNFNLSHLFE